MEYFLLKVSENCGLRSLLSVRVEVVRSTDENEVNGFELSVWKKSLRTLKLKWKRWDEKNSGFKTRENFWKTLWKRARKNESHPHKIVWKFYIFPWVRSLKIDDDRVAQVKIAKERFALKGLSIIEMEFWFAGIRTEDASFLFTIASKATLDRNCFCIVLSNRFKESVCDKNKIDCNQYQSVVMRLKLHLQVELV